MKALVTVGTTSFERLVQAVDSEKVRVALERVGYHEILIQIGTGQYKPKLSKFFEYDENFEDIVESVDLVICHAGAGSIFAGVKRQKKVIAVVNSSLMHNHQQELAVEMARLGHILCCEDPEALIEVVNARQIGLLPSFRPIPIMRASTEELNRDIEEALT